MQKLSGSISTKTGVAPVSATAFAVAAKVKDGTITSSPAPMPRASSAMCSAEVPEFTATHSRPPTNLRELGLEGSDLGALGQSAGGEDGIDRGPFGRHR